MRILQFVYGLDAGGIESFVTQLNRCRQAFPAPFDFVTYTPRETRDFFQPDCEAEGSTIHKLGSDCSRFFPIRCMQKRWRAFRLLQRERYDVVHIHNSHSLCMVEAGLCRLAGVKAVFVHAHNTGISETSRLAGVKRGLHALLRPLWPLAAAQLLACCREAAVWMYGARRVQRGCVRVLTNGVRLSAYALDPARRQATRARLGLSNRFVVGHVGRFDAQKNHAFLLRAFAAVARTAPDAQLLLVGDGPLLEETRALSESLRVAEKTMFLGRS
ncbi:MAG TPA: glycosyltransferase, partial [Clostridia bacterium]|nr:glycosyltransferase [Clostridia bacterium]